MQILSSHFDPDKINWVHVADPDFTEYKLDYEYSILGYDEASNRLDMLLRFSGNGGHCLRHRHVATTATLILQGEQHLLELLPDGSTKKVVRKAGEYSLSGKDALPHLERGGPEGATIFLSLHAPDGVLFEYMDANLENVTVSTVQDYISRFEQGGILAVS